MRSKDSQLLTYEITNMPEIFHLGKFHKYVNEFYITLLLDLKFFIFLEVSLHFQIIYFNFLLSQDNPFFILIKTKIM